MDLEADGATFDSCTLAKPAAQVFSSAAVSTAEAIEIPTNEPVLGPSNQISALHSPTASPPVSPLVSPPVSASSHRVTPPLSHLGSPPRSRSTTPAPHPAADTSPSPPASRSPSTFTRQKGKRANEEPPPAQCKSKRSKTAASATATEPTIPRSSQRTAARTLTNNDPPVQRKSKRSATAVDPSSTQPSRKTSSAAVVSARSHLNIPGWFSSGLEMLQSPEIPSGERWMVLVELWVAFEKKEGFKERGFLAAKERPECVSEWIRRGRPPTWRPAITAVSKLELAFRTWWVSLQPKWRVSENGTIITADSDGDWDVLRKPGVNGLLSVLVALFYWGGIAKRTAKQRNAWAACVEDCILVLRQLVE